MAGEGAVVTRAAPLRIRLTTSMASGSNEWHTDDVLTVGQDIDENTALRLLESGSADPVATTKRSNEKR